MDLAVVVSLALSSSWFPPPPSVGLSGHICVMCTWQWQCGSLSQGPFASAVTQSSQFPAGKSCEEPGLTEPVHCEFWAGVVEGFLSEVDTSVFIVAGWQKWRRCKETLFSSV